MRFCCATFVYCFSFAIFVWHFFVFWYWLSCASRILGLRLVLHGIFRPQAVRTSWTCATCRQGGSAWLWSCPLQARAASCEQSRWETLRSCTRDWQHYALPRALRSRRPQPVLYSITLKVALCSFIMIILLLFYYYWGNNLLRAYVHATILVYNSI